MGKRARKKVLFKWVLRSGVIIILSVIWLVVSFYNNSKISKYTDVLEISTLEEKITSLLYSPSYLIAETQRNEAHLQWYQKTFPLLSEFPPISHRHEFMDRLQKLPGFTTGIEVGIGAGVFARKSLETWKAVTEYKVVDPTMEYLPQAKHRMSKWEEEGIVEFFLMNIVDAANEFPESHFDYVYLDAGHDYCKVIEDIQLYYPKLRPGGILGGHNYVDTQYVIEKTGKGGEWSTCEDGSTHHDSVMGAVNHWRSKHGLHLLTSKDDFPSWYLQKPY